jgi:hypothetical protein
VTQGSVEVAISASGKVGREPQEGRCPRVAPRGNTDSSAIETLKHPLFNRRIDRDGKPFLGSGGSSEVPERRAREHGLVAEEESALERERGRPRPALPERVERAEQVRGNPRSATGMKQAPEGSR